MNKIKLPTIDYEETIQDIGKFIIKKITKIGFSGGVIGLSGGVDSTLTAAIAKRTYDKYNATHENKLELVGYMLPSKISDSLDLSDAKYVAEKLGVRYEVVEISSLVNAYEKTDNKSIENLVEKGNLMSELRALVLHRKSAYEKKLVLGTGNSDEDFGIGYYTLFGDGAVHMSPIAGLSKRLVRQLASYMGFDELSKRVATAGLEVGQTDFKDLGYSYDLIELLCEGIKQGLSREDLFESSQVQDLALRDSKKYEELYGLKKYENIEMLLGDFFHRNYVASVKAKIVSPEVCKLNLRYDE